MGELLCAPRDIYRKGDTFKNMFWLKFDSKRERDEAITKFKKHVPTFHDNNVWMSQQLSIDQRAVRSFLFGLKKKLVAWEVVRQEIGVDPDSSSMSLRRMGIGLTL